jgi:iron complex transport system substrate-binding protein
VEICLSHAERREGGKIMRELDDITGGIIDCSLRIHMDLGPGLLESVYEVLLANSLQKRGFKVDCQRAIDFEYDGTLFT